MQELVKGALRTAGRTIKTGQGMERAFRYIDGLFRIDPVEDEQSAYQTTEDKEFLYQISRG